MMNWQKPTSGEAMTGSSEHQLKSVGHLWHAEKIQ